MVPSEIVLMVAERADLPTLSAMMQTSKFMNSLVKNYERSVVKAKVATSLDVVPPSGAILSSATYADRKVLTPDNFFIAQEIARRRFRIDALFGDDSMLPQVINKDELSFGFLPEDEMAKLIVGLKQAAKIVDRLGDCYIEGMHKAGGSEDEAVIGRQCHLAQLDLILHRLTLRELAFIKTLVDFCVLVYANVHPYAAADPSPWHRLAAFREALMRNGMLVLWSWLEKDLKPNINAITAASGATSSTSTLLTSSAFPSTSSAIPSTSSAALSINNTTPSSHSAVCKTPTDFTEKIVDDILLEIDKWEEGPRAEDESEFDQEHLALPSLYSTLITAYVNHTGRDHKRAAKDMEFDVMTAIKETATD